jgi:serine/threonine protein kinase
MEYICAGDLLNFIKKRTKLSEQTAKFIFKQIILAIQFIHSKKIIHRDIKLDNILIDLDNKIKLCDFGVSKFLNSTKLFDQCGTPAYIAPEILRNEGYDFSVDVWSAGVVLYAMLSGNVPFKGKNVQELHERILKGKFKEIDVSFECRDLIRKIFEIDVEKRIKIEEILCHSWFENNNGNFCLFTKAERILFDENRRNYENFDVKNLCTGENEKHLKNNRTKSVILAPFNSSFEEGKNSGEFGKKSEEFYDFNNKNLKLENFILKFAAKVKEINYNYELNNNCEIDNGIIISQNESKNSSKKIFSPLIIENSNKNSAKNVFKNKIFSSEKNNETNDFEEINLNAIKEMEKFGFNKEFVKNCIKTNENNYATTGYYLIVKYSNQNLN